MNSRLKLLVVFALVGAPLAACSKAVEANNANPAMPHFDAAGSDPKAIALADEVMAAMGGRKCWDETRCITWNFFGKRKQVWDKATGDYRLEEGDRVTLLNLNTGEGRVFEKGVEEKDPAKVKEALKAAKSTWINDSYWLVMPYKLKDDGVTLGYKAEDKLPDGRAADVITLMFKEVGDTPQNKYDVWISRDKHMVEQWAYYGNRADKDPKFTTAWGGWKQCGKIMLSGERKEGMTITDIAVLDTPPKSLHEL